jgi:hypothetical protein
MEALIHENENAFIDRRNFLLCRSCFWCVSWLTENRPVIYCPSCGNNEMQLNPVVEYQSYKLDDEYLKEIASIMRPDQGGGHSG